MNSKKGFLKMLGTFLVLILLVGIFAGDIMGLTYSAKTGASPDVIVTINKSGEISQEGSLLGDKLWYPGMEKVGVIRIDNQYRPIKGARLGVNVDLLRVGEGYNWDMVKNSFLQNMKLSINQGKLAIFDKEIIKNKSLGDLSVDSETTNDDGGKFSIKKNDFIDLQYKLWMDDEAGNELQDLSANISITMRLEESVTDNGNGDDNNNGGGKDKPVITEPEEPKDKEEDFQTPTDLIISGKAHWAHDCIITLLRHGVIRGYPDGTIRPDQAITRAESAALIAKALKLEKRDGLSTGYNDPIPEWARGHIIAVSEEGIFVGYPMKLFKAEKNISREEMITVLIKGFNKELYTDIELEFIDKMDIGDWALKYVRAGVGHEILRGYPDGSFRPQREITRAEAFTIICKLLGLHDEHL